MIIIQNEDKIIRLSKVNNKYVVNAEFKESEHPRDADGKFKSGSGDYTIAHKDSSGKRTVIAEVHKEDISPKQDKGDFKFGDYDNKTTHTKGNVKVVVRGNGQVRWYSRGKLQQELNQSLKSKKDIEEFRKHMKELGYK